MKVRPGPDGLQAFLRQLELIVGRDVANVNFVFRCRCPDTGAEIFLQGLQAFEAAMHCACVRAAQRSLQQQQQMLLQQRQQQQALEHEQELLLLPREQQPLSPSAPPPPPPRQPQQPNPVAPALSGQEALFAERDRLLERLLADSPAQQHNRPWAQHHGPAQGTQREAQPRLASAPIERVLARSSGRAAALPPTSSLHQVPVQENLLWAVQPAPPAALPQRQSQPQLQQLPEGPDTGSSEGSAGTGAGATVTADPPLLRGCHGGGGVGVRAGQLRPHAQRVTPLVPNSLLAPPQQRHQPHLIPMVAVAPPVVRNPVGLAAPAVGVHSSGALTAPVLARESEDSRIRRLHVLSTSGAAASAAEVPPPQAVSPFCSANPLDLHRGLPASTSSQQHVSLYPVGLVASGPVGAGGSVGGRHGAFATAASAAAVAVAASLSVPGAVSPLPGSGAAAHVSVASIVRRPLVSGEQAAVPSVVASSSVAAPGGGFSGVTVRESSDEAVVDMVRGPLGHGCVGAAGRNTAAGGKASGGSGSGSKLKAALMSIKALRALFSKRLARSGAAP